MYKNFHLLFYHAFGVTTTYIAVGKHRRFEFVCAGHCIMSVVLF